MKIRLFHSRLPLQFEKKISTKLLMGEFIVILVGQCGNQIGSCFLTQIIEEYQQLKSDNLSQFMKSFFKLNPKYDCTDNIRNLLADKRTKARFICIDMEDSVVARYRNGKYRNLFEKTCLITNYPGSGNNWADGYYHHGPEYKQEILKSIKYWVEKCNRLHGFLLLFSVGGGTGSGLGTFIVELLNDYYPKIERFVACVYPTGTEDVITCPYNIGFATEKLIENSTCTFPVENRNLLAILNKLTSQNATKFTTKSIFNPFGDLNSIIVDMLLHLTSGSRFAGDLNYDLNEINTNLVPLPTLKFLSTSFSPINLVTNNNSTNKYSKNELFSNAIDHTNQLIKINPISAKNVTISTLLLGRGDYNLDDMRNYVGRLQTKLRFLPWSKKSFKIGLCSTPPVNTDFAIFTLMNTTGMSGLFENTLNQFTKLYQKKAHVHHYVNIPGFEESYFNDCQNTLSNVIKLYRDLEKN